MPWKIQTFIIFLRCLSVFFPEDSDFVSFIAIDHRGKKCWHLVEFWWKDTSKDIRRKPVKNCIWLVIRMHGALRWMSKSPRSWWRCWKILAPFHLFITGELLRIFPFSVIYDERHAWRCIRTSFSLPLHTIRNFSFLPKNQRKNEKTVHFRNLVDIDVQIFNCTEVGCYWFHWFNFDSSLLHFIIKKKCFESN